MECKKEVFPYESANLFWCFQKVKGHPLLWMGYIHSKNFIPEVVVLISPKGRGNSPKIFHPILKEMSEMENYSRVCHNRCTYYYWSWRQPPKVSTITLHESKIRADLYNISCNKNQILGVLFIFYNLLLLWVIIITHR